MDAARRTVLKVLAAVALVAGNGSLRAAEAGGTLIRINIPGPRALPFLPIELIVALGIDRALGAQLQIRYFPSGVRALEDALAGNAQFAGLGFSVLPVFAVKGQKVLAVAPLSGAILPYAFLVRKDLAGRVRKPADLRGLSIGVSVGSVTSKTYLQMAAELTLSSYGVGPTEVRWVPMAQNIDGVFGALASQVVDAVFCEEPFVTNLLNRDAARVLIDVADPRVAARIPGANHLRAMIATSADFARENPQQAELMAKMLQRVLVWMRSATPEKMVAQLGVMDDTERRELISVLTRLPGMYSPDGRFVRQQVDAAKQFLLAAKAPVPADLDIHSLVMYQWSGHKP
jgi:NitT/TauT family transport system substrate-binding protein